MQQLMLVLLGSNSKLELQFLLPCFFLMQKTIRNTMAEFGEGKLVCLILDSIGLIGLRHGQSTIFFFFLGVFQNYFENFNFDLRQAFVKWNFKNRFY